MIEITKKTLHVDCINCYSQENDFEEIKKDQFL